MKKFFVLILAICALIVAGCDDSKPVTVKIGTIKYLNVSEEAFIKFYEETDEFKSDKVIYEQIFFDNMNTMIFALQSGQIDEMSTYETVAHYLENKSPDLEWTFIMPEMEDRFCCAMREEDSELKKEFDDAIKKLAEKGTLALLVKNYLSDVNFDEMPKLVQMPDFKNAPTIKIAVTGDLPMLDYVRPDGNPAGFNTQILAEISKIIGKNFEFVKIDSGARAAALASKKVDVIFWSVIPHNDRGLPVDFDKPEGVIMTVPYFSDNIVHVRLKK